MKAAKMINAPAGRVDWRTGQSQYQASPNMPAQHDGASGSSLGRFAHCGTCPQDVLGPLVLTALQGNCHGELSRVPDPSLSHPRSRPKSHKIRAPISPRWCNLRAAPPPNRPQHAPADHLDGAVLVIEDASPRVARDEALDLYEPLMAEEPPEEAQAPTEVQERGLRPGSPGEGHGEIACGFHLAKAILGVGGWF